MSVVPPGESDAALKPPTFSLGRSARSLGAGSGRTRARRFETNLAQTSSTTTADDGAEHFIEATLGPAHVLLQRALTVLTLYAVDVLAVGGALFAAGALAEMLGSPLRIDAIALGIVGAVPLAFGLFGLYPASGMSAVRELRQGTIALTALFVPIAGSMLAHPAQRELVPTLGLAFVFGVLLSPLARLAARYVFSRFEWWGQPILVIGDAASVAATSSFLLANPGLGLRPVEAPFDTTATDSAKPAHPWLGAVIARAREAGIRTAAVVGVEPLTDKTRTLVRRLSRDFARILLLPRGWDSVLPSLSANWRECGGRLGIEVECGLHRPGPRAVKRAIDVLVVSIGGLICLPFILVIAALVRLSSPGPAFYAQERVGGRRGRFRVWKFRTMVQDADAVLAKYLESDPALRAEWERDHKLKNDPRLITIGRFLRVTSLDELPQLWNVLVGDMSLVGPRPIVTAEIARYEENYELYRRVAPGITGLWQVSGRNLTTYAERVDFDSYYVRNWSPWLDIYILARTVKVVLFREGAF